MCKLSVLGDGISIASPSPRVRVLFDALPLDGQKTILYLGFNDRDLADRCYSTMARQFGKYTHKADTGICKPRKAIRVDGCPIEIKWHRPDETTVHRLIEKDLQRERLELIPAHEVIPTLREIPIRQMGTPSNLPDPYCD